MNATEARGAVTGLQIALRTQPNSFVARLVTSEHKYGWMDSVFSAIASRVTRRNFELDEDF